jgi:hypothetical protein
MEKKDWVNKEVENTLGSLDGLVKAEAPAFLYTRIEAKISKVKLNHWQSFALFLAKPIVATATIIIILALNVFAFYNDKEEVVVQDEEHVFAGEYSMANTTSAQDESFFTLNEDQ